MRESRLKLLASAELAAADTSGLGHCAVAKKPGGLLPSLLNDSSATERNSEQLSGRGCVCDRNLGQ